MFASSLGQQESSTRPPPSIDLVIERVYIVAGRVNELTHVVDDNAQAVASKGEEVVDDFNTHFASVSTKDVARHKFYGIPLSVFYTVLICALIAILLAMLFLIVYGVQKATAKKYQHLEEQPVSTVV